jgi:hypothetical protein
MKSLLLSTIYATLRVYVGAGLFNRVVGKALELMTSPLPGQEKMQIVIEFAQSEFVGLSSTLIRAIVEVFLLKQQG